MQGGCGLQLDSLQLVREGCGGTAAGSSAAWCTLAVAAALEELWRSAWRVLFGK